MPQTLTQNYQYDQVNRITGIIETGGQLAQTFSYDMFGNMAVTANQGITQNGQTPTSLSQFLNGQVTTNQWLTNCTTNPPCYDAAGNETGLGGDVFAYDAENRMISAAAPSGTTPTTYGYDGQSRRVWKTNVGSSSIGTTVYAYDTGGELTAEYSTAPPTGIGTEYMTSDQLGSTWLITNGSTTVKRYDYAPFGQEIPTGIDGRGSDYGAGIYPSSTDVQDRKFTGKERDAESGLDYFGARYYGSSMGRFMSPDWAAKATPVPYAKLDNPQSLNLYSYVLNNPLGKADPDGHCIEDACILEGAAVVAFVESPAGQRLEEEAEQVAERYSGPIEAGLSRASSWAGAQLARAGNALEEKAQEFSGMVKNTQRILQGKATDANYRVPDLMVKVGDDIKAIGEVKDTAKLGNSKQLTDMMGAAKDAGAKFSL